MSDRRPLSSLVLLLAGLTTLTPVLDAAATTRARAAGHAASVAQRDGAARTRADRPARGLRAAWQRRGAWLARHQPIGKATKAELDRRADFHTARAKRWRRVRIASGTLAVLGGISTVYALVGVLVGGGLDAAATAAASVAILVLGWDASDSAHDRSTTHHGRAKDARERIPGAPE